MGQAYKIVSKRLAKKTPKLLAEHTGRGTDAVFPKGNYIRKEYLAEGDIPQITTEEIEAAVGSLGKRKSPELDNIPAEYIYGKK